MIKQTEGETIMKDNKTIDRISDYIKQKIMTKELFPGRQKT